VNGTHLREMVISYDLMLSILAEALKNKKPDATLRPHPA